MAGFELPRKFVSQYPHKFAHGKNRYLRGERILPAPLTGRETVEQLIDRTFLAYNGGRLQQACRLVVEKMLGANVTVGLSLSGAMTPAGLGSSCLVPLIKAGFVDWIVSTGANLYHDMHHAMNLPLYRGSPFLADPELRRCGVVRIYDILLDCNDVLMRTDDVLRRILRQPEFQKEMGTAELHYRLGRYCDAWERQHGHRGISVLAAAYRAGVPCYSSSPGDSSIGMTVAGLELCGNQLRINSSLDVNETAAFVLAAKRARGKSAVIHWGGGSPKNFMLQTAPQIQEILGISESGHDYFLQVTDARPDTGGLSGATPSEAVSWGKVDPDTLPDAVVCYTDTTIAMPLLTSYALAKHKRRKLRRLYDQRPEVMQALRKEFLALDHGKRRDGGEALPGSAR